MKTLKYLGGSDRFISAEDLKAGFGIEVDYPIVANPSHRTCLVDEDVCDALVAMDPTEWADGDSPKPVAEPTLEKADGLHPISTQDPAIAEAEVVAAPAAKKPKG